MDLLRLRGRLTGRSRLPDVGLLRFTNRTTPQAPGGDLPSRPYVESVHFRVVADGREKVKHGALVNPQMALNWENKLRKTPIADLLPRCRYRRYHDRSGST